MLLWSKEDHPLHRKVFKHYIYVIDHMHTRFFHALWVTICAFLEIKNSACIVTHCKHIVSAISRIVSPRTRTVRPKLADTKFCRSFVTMTPFSCVLMGPLVFLRKLFANGDCRLRTDIQVELPHSSNRYLHLLTVCTLIFTQMTMRAKTRKGTSIGNPNACIVM